MLDLLHHLVADGCLLVGMAAGAIAASFVVAPLAYAAGLRGAP